MEFSARSVDTVGMRFPPRDTASRKGSEMVTLEKASRFDPHRYVGWAVRCDSCEVLHECDDKEQAQYVNGIAKGLCFPCTEWIAENPDEQEGE